MTALIDRARTSRDPRQSLAEKGERLAERHLEGVGMLVLARRFRVRGGEIDLVALDGPIVVFVEVKTRRGTHGGRPAEAVTVRKQRHLAVAAVAFLQRRGWLDRVSRFDVVEVVVPVNGPTRIRHLRNAFRPEE